MRRIVFILGLTVASCAPAASPPPGPAADQAAAPARLDQGWSAQDEAEFATTAQGSHVMPMAWFEALRRTDRDEAFAADRLARYGYIPGDGALPVGFVRDGSAEDPQLGMTCAACHTGQVRYRGTVWRVDGGRAESDFQAFLVDLGAAVRATLADDRRFAAFAAEVEGRAASAPEAAGLRAKLAAWSGAYDAFMGASLPSPAWGPGRLDAFGMIFNRVSALDLADPGNYHKADAPVRYPFIWDAPRQDKTQWTGAAPNGTYVRGLARNTGEVFGVFGVFTPRKLSPHLALYRNSVDLGGLQALEEKVVALRAPRWPAAFGFDAALAHQGQAVFETGCAECHGVRPSREVANAWDTAVRAVGTDPRTFLNASQTGSADVLAGTQMPPVVGERLGPRPEKLSILANAVIGSLLLHALEHDDGLREALRRDVAEDRLPFSGAAATPAKAVVSATTTLYKAAPPAPSAAYEARVLTGIWAVAPYLHNGSVPSLSELLKPPGERVTRFAVGPGEFDPINVGLAPDASPGRAVFAVDASLGNGNGGHDYGTGLPDADKRALIEYLKSL